MQIQTHGVEDFAAALVRSASPIHHSPGSFAIEPETAIDWLELGDELGAELEELGEGSARLKFDDGRFVELLPAHEDDPHELLYLRLPKDVAMDAMYRNQAVTADDDYGDNDYDEDEEDTGGGAITEADKPNWTKRILIGGAIVVGVAGVAGAVYWGWKRFSAKNLEVPA